MLEYIMLNIILKISMHYMKKGICIEKYADIAGTALEISMKNKMERLHD